MGRPTPPLRSEEKTNTKSQFSTGASVKLTNELNVLPLQINMDDCCGEESEEKNPYPANDYIGNIKCRHVKRDMSINIIISYKVICVL